MQNYDILIYYGLGIVGIVIVSIMLRELTTWYFRINDIVANQQRIIELLEKLTHRET